MSRRIQPARAKPIVGRHGEHIDPLFHAQCQSVFAVADDRELGWLRVGIFETAGRGVVCTRDFSVAEKAPILAYHEQF